MYRALVQLTIGYLLVLLLAVAMLGRWQEEQKETNRRAREGPNVRWVSQ